MSVDPRFREMVLEVLREEGVIAAPVYSTTNLPPGFTSAEAFAKEARRLFGSSSPFKAGRAWNVPTNAWTAARTRRAPSAAPVPTSSSSPDALLAASGLRLVARARP